ncbi:MAG TPA: hypothetical protein VG934_00085 [Candidatus Paceibacterota bacterium]|nr:hypothetical protein [Candidatus Paceibacterota bacterium]
MDKYFTKTFFRFFLSFLVIIGAAYGVMCVASAMTPPHVDITAHPE